MFNGLTGWHLLIVLAIVVFIFGAAKLPALAKSIGQSMKIFRDEVKPEGAPPASSNSPQNDTSEHPRGGESQ